MLTRCKKTTGAGIRNISPVKADFTGTMFTGSTFVLKFLKFSLPWQGSVGGFNFKDVIKWLTPGAIA